MKKTKKENVSTKHLEHIRFADQKKLIHTYTKWLYEMVADGSFYDLPMAKRIKKLPEKGSYGYENIPIYNKHKKNNKVKQIPYLEKFYACCENVKGKYNAELKQYKIVSNRDYCNLGFCPACEVKRSMKEYSKLMYRLEKFGDKYEYYFLTLTLPNNKDGFGDELKLYKKCLKDLLFQFGFKEDKSGVQESICAGAYGSYEITNRGKGWHPHLHLILAYPKEFVKDYKDHKYLTRDGREIIFCDNFEVQGKKRSIQLNYDKIVQLWIKYVTKYTDKYDSYLKEKYWFDVNFVKVTNVNDGIKELAKYLIDFNCITSKEDLFVFIRDSYGTKQRLQRGCFRMTPEAKEEYKEYMDRRAKEENSYFIQSNGWEDCIFTWHHDVDARYLVWVRRKELKQKLWTNVYYEDDVWIALDPFKKQVKKE